jgi:hypothetical protein
MASDWVVSIWILACVQQQSNNLNVTKIRRQTECQMAIFSSVARNQPASVLDVAQGRRDRQIDSGAAPNQAAHGLKLAMQRRCV